MLKKIGHILNSFSSYFFLVKEEQEPEGQKDNQFKQVEQARREWRDAQSRFNQVSDPDLVDHAVYAVEAAERRYIYLIKKAREEGTDLYCRNQAQLNGCLARKE